MLTKTALRSPRYLARIKAAVVAAVKDAKPAQFGLCHFAGPRGIGRATVNDRHGKPSIYVVFYSGNGPEFFDRQDYNITETVLAALRTWHAEQRAALPPLMEVRQASPSEWLAACERAGAYLLGADHVYCQEGA